MHVTYGRGLIATCYVLAILQMSCLHIPAMAKNGRRERRVLKLTHRGAAPEWGGVC